MESLHMQKKLNGLSDREQEDFGSQYGRVPT